MKKSKKSALAKAKDQLERAREIRSTALDKIKKSIREEGRIMDLSVKVSEKYGKEQISVTYQLPANSKRKKYTKNFPVDTTDSEIFDYISLRQKMFEENDIFIGPSQHLKGGNRNEKK